MTRKAGESLREYKKRVLDPISTSFCAAKWYNASLYLNQGTTSSCHLPPVHRIPTKNLEKDPSLLHNTFVKKIQRKMMLEGKKPKPCHYCWKIEELGKEMISDRVLKSEVYDDEDVYKITSLGDKENIIPKTLELSFSRHCNFACMYCNSGWSTTWAKDIRENGPYENLQAEDAQLAYTMTGDERNFSTDEKENPYIQAFWQWWPELKKHLYELRLTGGEPLTSENTWRLIDDLIHEPAPQLKLAINTNLSLSPTLLERLIEKGRGVKALHLYTSCEAYGEQAEYIRDGLNFKSFMENLDHLMEAKAFEMLHIMMTLNALNFFSMTEFMTEVMSLKTKYSKKYPIMSFNILRQPLFFSPLVLPEEIREELGADLKQWLAEYKNHPYLVDMEAHSLERTIEYLAHVDSPVGEVKISKREPQDLFQFLNQYDQRRKKNFRHVFPEHFVRWLDQTQS